MKLTEGDKQSLIRKYGKGSLFIVTLEAAHSDNEDIDKEDTPQDEDFVFRKPDMKTLSATATFEEKDPVRAAQIMFNDCLVWGDKEASNDPERFISISPYLGQLLKTRKVTLGKL